jgi:hypothetical protein
MGRQRVDQYPQNSAGVLTYGLTWLPLTYNNTSRTYPLIISMHGTGESGSTVGDLAKMYNASPRAVAGRIADGWNAVAMNPTTGLMDSFIVVSPQAPAWSYSYVHLKFILPNIISRYRVDTSRIYLVGLSAGGDGTYTTLGSRDSNFIKKFAAMATASTAGVSPINNSPNGTNYTSLQVEEGIRFGSTYGVRMWTVCGEQDYLLNTGVRYHDSTNMTLPTPANKLTVIFGVGHSAWGRAFDPAFRPNVNYYGRTGTCNNGCNNGGVPVAPNSNGVSVMGTGVTQDSLNVYEWLLLSKRNFAPVTTPSANAGTDQVIVLPANSVTLSGSGTPGEGYSISSYGWTKTAGPSSFTIQSPASPSTTVSNLEPGTYTFRLTVTNNIGATATDDVLVTVNAQSYSSPRISTISPAQAITLPTNTVNLTSAYVLNGATIQSVKWSKLKVPGQAKKKIGVIGSSTSEGNGASSGDSSYVGRLRNYLVNTHGIADSVINFGKSGYTVFHGMPSSYTPTAGQQTPDVTRNVTAILNRNVDVVIVNFPTNGFDVFSISEIMMAFRTIYDSCTAKGVDCYITTTQPRDEFGPAHRLFLKEIRDSILNRFGANAINFYDPVTIPGATTTMPEYAYGDLIHVNNAGHLQLFNKVVAANILGKFATSASTISSPSLPNTTINDLTVGTHLFQLSVTDSHIQSVNGVVSVTVNPQSQNQAPVVNAGNDQAITLPVNSVTLTGSATDADGTISSYQWTKYSGPTGGTIASPTQPQTVINSLLQGTYEYILTATDNNGATGTDTVRVVVNPAPPPPACPSARSYTPAPAGDRGYYNTLNLNPGDTLFIDGTKDWSYFYVAGQRGTPTCPIYIINKGGMATLRGGQLKLRDCEYVKVLGTGVQNLQYGILVKPYPDNTVQNGAFAVVVEGRSKNIEISNVSVRNCGIGFDVKEDGGCDPNYNFPNWTIDSISIHHNSIVNCWNQGMYLGNTSPDNGPNSYSPRPVVCNGVTTYPRPARLGNIKVYNNFVDSTGRAGIQLSSASKGVSEIYNNIIKHNGMGGDDAQGGGITIGAYSKVYIHDNTVVNTYTWGINSQGGSGTNVPLRIENNSVDSSGYLRPYVDQPSGIINDIRNAPTRDNLLIWPHSVLVVTKPTLFTDSTMFWIKTNSLGNRKNPAGIGLVDYEGTMHKSGNFICGNVNQFGGGTPVVAVEGTIPVFYSTTCNNGNTPPAANAGMNQTITLPTNSVTLTGEGIDIDGTITAYTWTKVSGPAQGTITSPSQSQTTVTAMVQGVYKFLLTVTDNDGATGKDTVQITVNASNQPPTANAGANQTITLPTNSVTLIGSGTDVDGTITGYAWSKLSGPSGGTIASPSQAQTTVTAMVQGVYQFVLTVTDNNGATGRDTVQVTVNPAANIPPTANAGANQTITLPTNSVTLTGSGTDVDGTITAYVWSKLSGPSGGTITSPSQAQTTVTAMVQGVYQFVLTVTDNNGATGKDTVQVTVNAANIPPTANAGVNQTITLPANSVTLNGSGTDVDGIITAYLWSKLSGPTGGTITSPSQPQTTVTAMVQGVYQFVLTVTDNNGATGKDTVQITVNAAANQPPTANAGANQSIILPVNSVTLTGSGTDVDGTIAGYAWNKLSGPANGTITSPSQAQTTVTGMVQGVYQFVLTVTDNNGATGKDTVEVIVNPANNQPPTANAGTNQSITLPTNSVTLTGSGIDPDGTIASYAWNKLSGPANGTITSPSQAQTTVTGMVQGVYQFVLTVTDNDGAIGKDTVLVTVNAAANVAPTANAGVNQTITLPTNSTTLSGSGTDIDGTITAYAWSKLSGPSGGAITSPAQPQTTITAMVQGVYQFVLTVTDNNGATGKDTVQVTVSAAAAGNQPPTANAGIDQTITLPDNSVILIGSGTDVDGTITAYQWSKLSGPASGLISATSQAQTAITNMVEGVYQFVLTVTDNNGASRKDTVAVTVEARAKIGSTVKIYPNPAASSIAILEFDAETKANNTFVAVYDESGLLIMKKEFMRNDYQFNYQLDISTLPKGMYFVHVKVDINNTKILKLIRL